jgi:tetratricopeptide (TPR) repeat protein
MSPKIRKKDPCPCGSGKRYKDCCFKTKKYSSTEISSRKERPVKIPPREKLMEGSFTRKEGFPISRLAIMRFEQDLKENTELLERLNREFKKLFPEKSLKDSISEAWNTKKLREMSTEEIIDKLKFMNVVFDGEQFKKQVQDYVSAIELAEDHYYTQDVNVEGPEEDFIWLAIIELWNRLIPDKVNTEMIDDAMYTGYILIEQGNYEEGLKEWEAAWDMMKAVIPPEITSVEKADEFMPELTQCLFNWCQDFEMELYNGGLEDRLWFEKRITYTNEFCHRFLDTKGPVQLSMLRAEARSYAMLGDIERAESLFRAVTKKFPENVWAYIGWGDIYWLLKNESPNYVRAEEIYRLGLDYCTDEIDKLHERLQELEKEKNSHA